MTHTPKVGTAQPNLKLGDVAGNLDRAWAACAEADRQGADLLDSAEAAFPGDSREDLVLQPAYHRQAPPGVKGAFRYIGRERRDPIVNGLM